MNASRHFQMTNIDKQHEIVKASLFQFVNTHITAADLSVVDEIVLNYVISILEEASEDPNFDVDGEYYWMIIIESKLAFNAWSNYLIFHFSCTGFAEMMSAYFPDFSQIETATVCEWLFRLQNQMSNEKKAENSSSESASKKWVVHFHYPITDTHHNLSFGHSFFIIFVQNFSTVRHNTRIKIAVEINW